MNRLCILLNILLPTGLLCVVDTDITNIENKKKSVIYAPTSAFRLYNNHKRTPSDDLKPPISNQDVRQFDTDKKN